MSLKIGNTNIIKGYLGGAEIKKAYLGGALVYDTLGVNYYTFNGTTGSMNTNFTMNTNFSGTNISFLIEGRINTVKAGNYFLGNDTNYLDLYFYLDATSILRAQVQDNGGEADIVKGSVEPYLSTTTDWHQWLFVFDGTASYVYLDGTLYDSETDNITFVGYDVGTPSPRFGVDNATNFLDGDIRYIQMYNEALSATDATNLVANLDYNTTNLVVDFRNNKTATTWTDDVSGYVATVSGGVTLV